MLIRPDLYDRPSLKELAKQEDPDEWLTKKVADLDRWLDNNKPLWEGEEELVSELRAMEGQRQTLLMLDLFSKLIRLLIERHNRKRLCDTEASAAA